MFQPRYFIILAGAGTFESTLRLNTVRQPEILPVVFMRGDVMPELPAMENFRRSIEKEALHRKIVEVTVKQDRVVHIKEENLCSLLFGKSFEEVLRHGKYIFLRAGKGNKAVWLSFHCGMTGYFTFQDRDDKTLVKAKLAIYFKDGGLMAFFDPRMFGRVELVENPKKFIEHHHLGIDAAAVSLTDFSGFLAASKKPLKVFFLDQSIMAGIGNVYGDEIPFQAKISPLRKANSLSKTETTRLYHSLVSVLKTAISKKAYLDHWDMLPRSWLVHYRKVGAICPRCAGKVTAYKAGGRDGYYCSFCQL